MFTNLLVAWVKWVTKHAWIVLALLLTTTVGLSWVAVSQFKMNSDLSTLINQNAPWRTHFDDFEANFPDLVRTAVVVVKSESVAELRSTTQEILDYLGARPELFTAVSAPGSEPFFRDHAFLYMSLDELDDTIDQLAEAQPWLTAVAQDPSARGVLALLEDGLRNDPPAGLGRVLELMNQATGRALAGADPTIAWTDELFDASEPRYQLIFLKANSSFSQRLPDAQIMAELRSMIAALPPSSTTTVSITGELALQHEEIEAAVGGVTLAGWLAIALLLAVMTLGVRSIKIMLATFSMLGVGVVWTTAFAMLSVGEFNTLSVVFIVMFFGLGVDFALHFSLRYQEAVNDGEHDVSSALLASTASVGRAISLCTLTTALGFLGFWPTDYQGLADLGVISAGGMAIAWLLTFTLLPAFFALIGIPRAHQMDLPTSQKLVSWLNGHRFVVIGLTIAVGIAAAVTTTRANFDYSVLALKDETAESMRTLRELQREGLSTDYQLVVLSDAPLEDSQLEALSVVDHVRRPDEYLPMDIEDKLYGIGDIQQLLWSALEPATQSAPPSEAQLRQSLRALANATRSLQSQGTHPDGIDPGLLEELAVSMQNLSQADAATIWRWQAGVIDNLINELEWLRRATNVDDVSLDDLPATIRARLISPQGRLLNVITPAEDISEVAALTQFIQDVHDVVPTATGRPVIEWGVGGIVVEAFLEAMVYALAAIAVVLMLALRKIVPTLLILLPLVLAVLLTLAMGVLFDQPINMANILVLPLIFGLGVDNGIHVVDRYLGEGDVDQLIHSSTPRAVLMSSLTTIGAFAALSTSPHAGTASIGWLLTIAVGLLLILTIILLPVLLSSNRKLS